MADTVLDDLRNAGVLGNTSVAPDGKDLLSAAAGAGAGGAALLASAPSLPELNVEGATSVLVLRNMVAEADTTDEEEMSDILEDTKTECEKHGAVRAAVRSGWGTWRLRVGTSGRSLGAACPLCAGGQGALAQGGNRRRRGFRLRARSNLAARFCALRGEGGGGRVRQGAARQGV